MRGVLMIMYCIYILYMCHNERYAYDHVLYI